MFRKLNIIATPRFVEHVHLKVKKRSDFTEREIETVSGESFRSGVIITQKETLLLFCCVIRIGLKEEIGFMVEIDSYLRYETFVIVSTRVPLAHRSRNILSSRLSCSTIISYHRFFATTKIRCSLQQSLLRTLS